MADRLINMSPVKPVSDYLEDMTTLQGAIASYGSEVLVQSRTFNQSGLFGYESAQELASVLQSGGIAVLSVLPTDLVWSDYVRVRMGSVRSVASIIWQFIANWIRCWLNGVKANSTYRDREALGLRLELTTNGQFFDRDLRTQAPRAFIGDRRRIMFEYAPSSKVILCDGNYGQERDYTKHSPMAMWQVRIDDRMMDGVAAAELDFSGFTDIRLEFSCEFVWADVA
jgi:hypothetical protein